MKKLLIIITFICFTVDIACAEPTHCVDKRYNKITIYYKSVDYLLYVLGEPWGTDDFLQTSEPRLDFSRITVDNRHEMKRLLKIINDGKIDKETPLLRASRCADFVVIAYGNSGIDTISIRNCPECSYEICGTFATNPKLLNYVIKLIKRYDREWKISFQEEEAWFRRLLREEKATRRRS